MEEQENDKNPSFEKRFGWFAIINRVALDDLSKHDETFRKPLVEILNQLTYLIQKDQEIEKQRKKAMGQIS
jgi:hypothetical protein